MSEPNSSSDPTPPVPRAPSYTYGGQQPNGTPLQAYGTTPQPFGTTPQPYGNPPRRRTWDLVLTIILLVVGFFGMISGIGIAFLFVDPTFTEAFNQGLGQQGLGGEVDFGSFPTIAIVSHVVLYLVALGLSILLLVTRKIAFYVPLAAGIVAAIVFWGGYFAVVFSAIDLTQFR